MIRTEKEYQDARTALQKDKEFIELQRKTLAGMSLTPEEIERAMEPTLSFHLQLQEEVEYYEKIKRGDFSAINNLTQMGRLLIALRIYKNITQKELADRLCVSEAMISRDEKNEYHGVSLEKAQRIISALKANISYKVNPDCLDEEYECMVG